MANALMAILLAKRAYPKGMTAVPDEVADAIDQLPHQFGQQSLSAGPSLDMKKMAKPEGAWRLRVADWRAIFFPSGTDFVVAAIGLRKDVYERADRMRLARKGEGLKIIEVRVEQESLEAPGEGAVATVRARKPAPAQQNQLSPFDDSMLLSIDGVDQELVAFMRSLPPSVDIGDVMAERLDDVDLAFLLADLWERPAHHLSVFAAGGTPSVADLAVEEAELAERLQAGDSLTELLPTESAAQIRRVLESSIEEWMLYLHPDQRAIVNADFNGPSRVRGGPGTGKTVVALHRARILARKRIAEGEKVLLTTFLSTLPKIWESLLGTLDSKALANLVVDNIDKLAKEIVVAEHGDVRILSPDERRKLGEPLLAKYGLGERLGENVQLLFDEFDSFLSGRAIDELEPYLALRRRGGGSPLAKADREKVFAAFQEYLARLAKQGAYDWPMLRLEALRLAESGKGPRFNGVIVDEAQDLSAVGMRLLLALDVSEDHRHFTIIGDGQQSIYPGGFYLGELGIEIVGRSRVLTANWRNTWSVWLAAKAVVDGQEFDDLDEDVGLRPTGEEPEPLRVGDAAELHVVKGVGEEAELLAALIQDRLDSGVDPGDIAVLTAIRKKGAALLRNLSEYDIPVARLDKYEGDHSDGVLIGNFHRAKGLEFKEVLIPGLAADEWPSRWFVPNGLEPEQRAERVALQLRTLFVAMTRGRDRLTLISAGEPCEWVQAAEWAMDAHRY